MQSGMRPPCLGLRPHCHPKPTIAVHEVAQDRGALLHTINRVLKDLGSQHGLAVLVPDGEHGLDAVWVLRRSCRRLLPRRLHGSCNHNGRDWIAAGLAAVTAWQCKTLKHMVS